MYFVVVVIVSFVVSVSAGSVVMNVSWCPGSCVYL